MNHYIASALPKSFADLADPDLLFGFCIYVCPLYLGPFLRDYKNYCEETSPKFTLVYNDLVSATLV